MMGFLRARLLQVSLFDFLTPNPKSKHGTKERAKERVHPAHSQKAITFTYFPTIQSDHADYIFTFSEVLTT